MTIRDYDDQTEVEKTLEDYPSFFALCMARFDARRRGEPLADIALLDGTLLLTKRGTVHIAGEHGAMAPIELPPPGALDGDVRPDLDNLAFWGYRVEPTGLDTERFGTYTLAEAQAQLDADCVEGNVRDEIIQPDDWQALVGNDRHPVYRMSFTLTEKPADAQELTDEEIAELEADMSATAAAPAADANESTAEVLEMSADEIAELELGSDLLTEEHDRDNVMSGPATPASLRRLLAMYKFGPKTVVPHPLPDYLRPYHREVAEAVTGVDDPRKPVEYFLATTALGTFGLLATVVPDGEHPAVAVDLTQAGLSIADMFQDFKSAEHIEKNKLRDLVPKMWIDDTHFTMYRLWQLLILRQFGADLGLPGNVPAIVIDGLQRFKTMLLNAGFERVEAAETFPPLAVAMAAMEHTGKSDAVGRYAVVTVEDGNMGVYLSPELNFMDLTLLGVKGDDIAQPGDQMLSGFGRHVVTFTQKTVAALFSLLKLRRNKADDAQDDPTDDAPVQPDVGK